MIENNDWRLTNQKDYLTGVEIRHTDYTCQRDGWEHDHCGFCMETIDASTGPAYCTLDGYHWVCEKCFNDFVGMFGWKVS